MKNMSRLSIFFFICALSVKHTIGYAHYKDKVPNARQVINPITNSSHTAVGHFNPDGKGTLNCFGKDFQNSRYDWQTVCPLDSDNDGLTNGQELGDPNCVWTIGTVLSSTTPITSPGICNPSTARCKNWDVNKCQTIPTSRRRRSPKFILNN